MDFEGVCISVVWVGMTTLLSLIDKLRGQISRGKSWYHRGKLYQDLSTDFAGIYTHGSNSVTNP